jgi:hypothetical protein
VAHADVDRHASFAFFWPLIKRPRPPKRSPPRLLRFLHRLPQSPLIDEAKVCNQAAEKRRLSGIHVAQYN